MYQLLIVEDEDIIRNGLEIMVDDMDIPFSTILKAENGLEALNLAAERKPEVILADIKMPEMDGLEFIKKLRNMGSRARIIILTGYNEFDYAREAIQYKVTDYLLKPIEIENLEHCLRKALNEWQEQQSRELLLSYQSQFISDTLSNLNEKKLREVLFGIGDENSTFTNFLLSEGISMHCPYFIVCYGEIYSLDLRMREMKGLNWQTIIKSELSKQYQNVIVLPGAKNTVICIANFGTMNDFVHFNNPAGIIDSILMNCKFNVTWGVSRESIVLDDVSKLFNQAKIALMEKILYGRGKIYYVSELFSQDGSFHITDEDMRNIFTYLEIKDYEKLQRFIDRHFEEWVTKRHIPVKKLMDVLDNICFQAVSYFEGVGCRSASSINLIDDFTELFLCCNGADDVKKLFINTLIKIRSSVGNKIKESFGKKSILYAREFIHKNFHKDINLDMIANHISMNPSYFSVLFKKELGISLVDYIIDIRINKALEYLRDPQYRIYEIAAKVGFNDENYFYKVFKKKMGIAPTVYREKNLLL